MSAISRPGFSPSHFVNRVPKDEFLSWCETHIQGSVQGNATLVGELFFKTFNKEYTECRRIDVLGSSVYTRYTELTKDSFPYWTHDLDQKLVELFEKHGGQWTLLGRLISPQPIDGKRVRNHYMEVLNPSRIPCRLIPDEDLDAFCALLASHLKAKCLSWPGIAAEIIKDPILGVGKGPQANDIKMFCSSEPFNRWCLEHNQRKLLVRINRLYKNNSTRKHRLNLSDLPPRSSRHPKVRAAKDTSKPAPSPDSTRRVYSAASAAISTSSAYPAPSSASASASISTTSAPAATAPQSRKHKLTEDPAPLPPGKRPNLEFESGKSSPSSALVFRTIEPPFLTLSQRPTPFLTVRPEPVRPVIPSSSSQADTYPGNFAQPVMFSSACAATSGRRTVNKSIFYASSGLDDLLPPPDFISYDFSDENEW